ncbi:MAG: hypothetical protein VYD07_10920 [Pseudomonadota bacterium]|jgi:hypothetical protein|uniref:hypothetical protein n=1 Tax=Idiomarina sp. TaxID=1874361 RepID=UPI0025843DF0|nr:hypothetical protein [Idiomarina sp.]MEC8926417.1 hypothetical protein [Pseudomonadota bacterium]
MIDFVGWYKQPELDGVNPRTAHRAITVAKFRAKLYRRGSFLLRQCALLSVVAALLILPSWHHSVISAMIIISYLGLAKWLNIRAYRTYALPLLPQAVQDASKY